MSDTLAFLATAASTLGIYAGVCVLEWRNDRPGSTGGGDE